MASLKHIVRRKASPATGWRYGTMLRYSRENDPEDKPTWVFMHLGIVKSGYDNEDWVQAQVIEAPEDDDYLTVGVPSLFGLGELVPLDE